MSGGRVLVKGHADGQVAAGMTGGKLTVDGNAGWTANDGHLIGVLMGGEVRIGGDFELYDGIKGGKIYKKVDVEWEIEEDFDD